MKLNKIKPLFNTVITTANKYEDEVFDESGIIDVSKKEGTLKEYQEVLAVGSVVRDVKVGDIVVIDPTRFAVKKYHDNSMNNDIIQTNPVISYNFKIITVNEQDVLFIQDRDVDFIIEEYE